MIDDWLTYLRAAGRPDTTIRLRRHQLQRLEQVHPDLAAVTTDDLVRWLGRPGWSADTRRSHRAAVVTFYAWAARTGRIPGDPTLTLPCVRPSHHVARPAPDNVITEALASADDRVWLMLSLAARCGLRRGEIAQVHSADLVRDLVGWSLTVRGKGGRQRIVPVPDALADVIRLRGDGWLFPGRIDGHLSPARVGDLISGALLGDWTAHTLRHRFATAAYAGSRDLLAVQDLLGHAKPETTRTYVRPPSDALRAAAAWAA